MLLTIFLGILVLALILGNIFLSIAKPKKIEEALLMEIQNAKSSQVRLPQTQNNENTWNNSRALLQQRSNEMPGSNGSALLQQMQSNKNIAASNQLLQQGKIRPAFVSAEQPDFRQIAEIERTRILNKRVDRLESLLLKMNGAKFVSYKLNGANLEQKLGSLEEFKQNTSLEIAALKQQLAALKEDEPLEESNVVMEPTSADEERAHSIVYHGGRRDY